MKRIIVIGCPGSGKSTFSKALSKALGLPLYHLDMMYWNEDKTTVEKSVFLDKLSKVLEKDEWIIDGNYASTMELRIKRCDTVVFLDFPTDVCLEGVKVRQGKPRSDIPWCDFEDDREFVEFIKNYNLESKPKVLELLEKYNEKTVLTFANRSESDGFLAELVRKYKY